MLICRVVGDVVSTVKNEHLRGHKLLLVDLTDGRIISVPLAWYPRLLHGKPEERSNWRFIGKGEGIHWPAWMKI